MQNPSPNWAENARHQILANRAEFDRVLKRIEARARAGRDNEAAVLAQSLGSFAWLNHTGLFASPELENSMLAIGRRVCPAAADAPVGERKGVCHVLSKAYHIGGHTRGVRRWIGNDKTRRHSIVVTGQPGLKGAPPDLFEAARASGGEVHDLAAADFDLPARAKALREIARAAEIVILHIHPSDVIPLLAFADPGGLPPVVLSNHADHVFWLGARVTNLIANMREGSVPVNVKKRQVPPTRNLSLPISLEAVTRVKSRAEAKATLGLPADAVVLLSVASSYKFAPLSDEMYFLNWQKPLLAANPNLHLIVVGVGDDPHWAPCRELKNVHLIAVTPQLRLYYEAADIYVDSLPLGSPTSALEAALFETPVVGHRFEDPLCDIFRGDAPGLTGQALLSSNPREHQKRVQELIDDERRRLALGKAIAAQVRRVHIENWQADLEAIYARARELTPMEFTGARDAEIGELDLLVAETHRRGQLTKNFASLLLRTLAHSPTGLKLKYAARPKMIQAAFATGFALLKSRIF